MRIVGGTFRGRKLATPANDSIRPTTDRTRESLFNILSNRIDFNGLRVIDLFAGTGALGVEALSRGAAFCQFVEKAPAGCNLIRQNIEALGVEENTHLQRTDATRLKECSPCEPFDLAFMDPPYGKKMAEKSAACLLSGGWLKENAQLVIEETAANAPTEIPGFQLEEQRRFGGSTIVFFRVSPN